MKKVVLVTGASSGFGKIMAEYLSRKGCSVWGTSRHVAADVSAAGFRMVEMDVRNVASIRAAVETVIEIDGRIDVLINNAGISIVSPLAETPLETVHQVIDVNLYGVLRVSQAVIPAMMQQRDGLIINVSSIGGLVGLPFRGVYSASKFGLEGLTESLSMELKAKGISVCMIEPGDFRTAIAKNRLRLDLKGDSVYREICARVEATADEQLENAPLPDRLGPLVYRIINSDRRRLRYRVGSLTEKLSVLLKIILPARCFEHIILGYYDMRS